jgi:hypothetical protein
MHKIKISSCKNSFISYPEFSGEGYSTANSFYEELANAVFEYFSAITTEDSSAACRCLSTVDEDDDGFTVTVRLILRRGGKRCGDKTILHRWRCADGRDAVLVRPGVDI